MRSFVNRHALTTYFVLARGLPTPRQQLAPRRQEVLVQ